MRVKALRIIYCALVIWPWVAQADQMLDDVGVRTVSSKPIESGQRLSEHLGRHGYTLEHYLEGTCWSTEDTRILQADRYRALSMALSTIPTDLSARLSDDDRLNWRQTLARLRPTGCVSLPETDPQRLAVFPEKNPILRATDRVTVPPRPRAVAVIQADGQLCSIEHKPAASVLAYVQACKRSSHAKLKPSVAWLIQPQTTAPLAVGLELWNEAHRDSPAPGSWIWLESVDLKQNWPAELKRLWMDFLVGQGVYAGEPRLVISSLGSDRRLLAKELSDLSVTTSDWGTAGLLQTPSARFPKAGQASISFSKTYPYGRLNFMLSPFDWLEAGFRYVDISNRAYGVSTTGQSNKDKSIDLKLRLLQESRYWPAMAVGIRDMGGTGLFAGEYLVGNKRFGSFDWSLGLGWGYLGARGDVSNPLGGVFSGFKTRPASTESAGTGGKFNTSTYFRGPAALFGGIQYQAPNSKWIWKLELEGNDYQSEPQSNNQAQRTALNAGVVYRWTPFADLTAAVERGNRLMVGLTLRSDLSGLSTPKVDDPPLFTVRPVTINPTRSRSSQVSPEVYQDIKLALQSQTRWDIGQIQLRNRTLRVVIEGSDQYDWSAMLDRANRVLHQMAPPDVTTFAYIVRERGLTLTEFRVDRVAWVLPKTQMPRPDIRLRQPMVEQPAIWQEPPRQSVRDEVKVLADAPLWKGGLGFAWAQSFGGPDAFMLYQLSAKAEGEWRPSRNTWVYGAAEYGLIDNYDQFSYTGTSRLPRVRTYAREYVVSADFRIPILQVNHTFKLGDNLYGQVYGGLLEPMFGGVGGELLYRPRPFDGPWSPFFRRFAIGVDLNRVRQRDFEQNFDWRDYEVTTGHATVYWDTGWQNIQAKLSAGQYLAGDKGVTLDVSRVFGNGVSIGAFATKTNVSSTDFGEGAFDKGIYVSIPFDVMMTRSTRSTAKILWRPLTRDGGAKLNRSNELFELTSLGSKD